MIDFILGMIVGLFLGMILTWLILDAPWHKALNEEQGESDNDHDIR